MALGKKFTNCSAKRPHLACGFSPTRPLYEYSNSVFEIKVAMTKNRQRRRPHQREFWEFLFFTSVKPLLLPRAPLESITAVYLVLSAVCIVENLMIIFYCIVTNHQPCRVDCVSAGDIDSSMTLFYGTQNLGDIAVTSSVYDLSMVP